MKLFFLILIFLITTCSLAKGQTIPSTKEAEPPITEETRLQSSSSLGQNTTPYYVLFYKGEYYEMGKEINTFQQLPVEDIEGVDVLKGQVALQQYGEKGKNGVIVVKVDEATPIDLSQFTKIDVPLKE